MEHQGTSTWLVQGQRAVEHTAHGRTDEARIEGGWKSKIVGPRKGLAKDVGRATGSSTPEEWRQWGARKTDPPTIWSQRRAGPRGEVVSGDCAPGGGVV